MEAHFYSVEQLQRIAGVTAKTIRRHINLGWLKAEKRPGVHGWRVSARKARTWLSLHYPTKINNLNTVA